MTTRLRKAARSMIPAIVAAMLLASCSSSSGNLAAACKDNLDVDNGFSKLFSETPALHSGPGAPKPGPDDVKQIQASFDRDVAPSIKRLQEDAPSDVQPNIKVAAAASRKFREGDTSAFNQPSNAKALTGLGAYFYNNCSGVKSAVSAIDYSFQGAPAQAKSGVFRVKFTNNGQEHHMMAVLARNPGVTDTFEQVLKLPREQAMSKTHVLNEVDTDPGHTDYLVANLPAGDYLLVCFVSKGSVGNTEGSGPPHFTLGMRQPLKVT